MDLTFSDSEERFREELRAYLEASIEPKWRNPDFWTSLSEDAGFELRRRWEADKAEAGFGAITWPVEYGGKGGTPGMKAIYDEELVKARAPLSANSLGLMLLAPTVMAIGTTEQKSSILGPMLRNEVIWCQGFSEPDAGSDLAGVRTKAVRDGDEFVVNGQKIWTTQAQHADKIFALVRTRPGSARHEGISMLLIDLHQPGVDVRPIMQMSGQSEFAEVFFDDARVPVHDCLGGIDNGWMTAMLLLSFERGASGIGYYTEQRGNFDAIARVAQSAQRDKRLAADDPAIRQALAAQLVELECLRYHAYHVLTEVEQGRDLGFGAAVTKLQWSTAQQRLWEAFDDALGSEVTVRDPLGPGADLGWMHGASMFARSVTIWGGSSEILRSIVGERILGLPR